MPLIFIFPGMMCYVLYRDLAQEDNAYITLVTNLMPAGLLGLCLAAIIAALIDTEPLAEQAVPLAAINP